MWSSLNEGRPGGAGNPRVSGLAGNVTVVTLNEGRPGGAGNPWRLVGQREPIHRSTKAGPVGPATPAPAN